MYIVRYVYKGGKEGNQKAYLAHHLSLWGERDELNTYIAATLSGEMKESWGSSRQLH